MEDESVNGNEKGEKVSSVSYPAGENSTGGNDSNSVVTATTPHISRGVGGCYSWGGVNRNGGGSSYAGPVDTEHEVKTGKVLIILYPVPAWLNVFPLPSTHPQA